MRRVTTRCWSPATNVDKACSPTCSARARRAARILPRSGGEAWWVAARRHAARALLCFDLFFSSRVQEGRGEVTAVPIALQPFVWFLPAGRNREEATDQ